MSKRVRAPLAVQGAPIGSAWTKAQELEGKYHFWAAFGRSPSHGHSLQGEAFPDHLVSSISIDGTRHHQEFTAGPYVPLMRYSTESTPGGWMVAPGTWNGRAWARPTQLSSSGRKAGPPPLNVPEGESLVVFCRDGPGELPAGSAFLPFSGTTEAGLAFVPLALSSALPLSAPRQPGVIHREVWTEEE